MEAYQCTSTAREEGGIENEIPSVEKQKQKIAEEKVRDHNNSRTYRLPLHIIDIISIWTLVQLLCSNTTPHVYATQC